MENEAEFLRVHIKQLEDSLGKQGKHLHQCLMALERYADKDIWITNANVANEDGENVDFTLFSGMEQEPWLIAQRAIHGILRPEDLPEYLKEKMIKPKI